MVTMYHGTSSATLPVHAGLCLTGDRDHAADYAAACYGTRYIHEVAIDLTGLTVRDLDAGYDRDANDAPADADPADFPGADVIVFADETPAGHRHTTWRLLTPAALAAITTITTTEEN